MDCFTLFCAVRKMALVFRNTHNLSYSGDISDRQRTFDIAFKHMGRFEDARLRRAALGSKLERLFWTWSYYFSTAVKKVARRLARLPVQCAVVGRSASVKWSQTSLNTPVKRYAS